MNDQINLEKVVAKMGQGILKVTLPKNDRQNLKRNQDRGRILNLLKV